MAESAFWLVGQCVCVLRSCSTADSMFVSLQLRVNLRFLYRYMVGLYFMSELC